MPIKITPLVEADEFYIVPYEKKSECYQLCLKFEIPSIKLETYECIKSFLINKKMDSKEVGYIITKKFEGIYKDIQSFKIENGKNSCVIHNITF